MILIKFENLNYFFITRQSKQLYIELQKEIIEKYFYDFYVIMLIMKLKILLGEHHY